MKIATLLFTYHRSYHLEQVLTSLKKNTILPQKLFIFQDGLKSGEDDCEWEKVNSLIHKINWCENEIIVSTHNRGLAASIISGINYAFKEYDAVIVLEDDCVLSCDFIKFMEQCFAKYKDNKKVYSVSGYSWPISLEKNQFDAYTCGRISTWGWGTWKDKWDSYVIDNDILIRLKHNKLKSKNLAMWGSDCEKMLLDKIAGKNDSWAIYWGLIVIENEGICINPYRSLIQNIGMDGSGVHCGKTHKFQVMFPNDFKETFILPDNTNILEKTKEAFASLYGSYTSINQEKELKEKILIYGLGNFYLQNEKDINEKYFVEAFVDRNKEGWFAGKKIIKKWEIGQYTYSKILIMVQNIQECMSIARQLIAIGVSAEKILLGHNFYGKMSECFDNIMILSKGNFSVTVGDISLEVSSMDEFNNVYEVLVNHIYDYYINNDRKDIVIDVGMNIGDAALYFLNNKRVKKVYAYEPFNETYLMAKSNLSEYLENKDRIEIMQYGISDTNCSRIINFNRDMSCDQSTIVDIREKASIIYQSLGIVHSEQDREEQIEVKDASEEFLPIIRRHLDCNIVLKMDCEGEEYGIIEKLSNEKILSYVTFIMLEWHYKGKNSILSILKKEGFSLWCCDRNEDMGFVYAINLNGIMK